MWNKLLSGNVDNKYNGHIIGFILLCFYTLKSFVSGSIHMFAPDGGAQSIASITLDKFTQGGADTVITIFAMWGMEQFVIGIISLIILLKYRKLVSLMAFIYAIEYIGRFCIPLFTPGVVTAHTPPGHAADVVLVPLTLIMLLLTLYIPKHKR